MYHKLLYPSIQANEKTLDKLAPLFLSTLLKFLSVVTKAPKKAKPNASANLGESTIDQVGFLKHPPSRLPHSPTQQHLCR